MRGSMHAYFSDSPFLRSLACTLFPSYWFVFFRFSLLFHLSFSPLFHSLSPHSYTRSFVCMYALFSSVSVCTSFSRSTTVFICKHTRKRIQHSWLRRSVFNLNGFWLCLKSYHFALFLLFALAQSIHIKIKAKGDRRTISLNGNVQGISSSNGNGSNHSQLQVIVLCVELPIAVLYLVGK